MLSLQYCNVVVVQMELVFLLLCLQVYPTALNLEVCDTQLHLITLTPTIPVRKTLLGYPQISFVTPKEATILEGCVLDLKETESVQIEVKATCGDVSEGLKPIIPRLIGQKSPFWHANVHLPTIWVISFVSIFPFFFTRNKWK